MRRVGVAWLAVAMVVGWACTGRPPRADGPREEKSHAGLFPTAPERSAAAIRVDHGLTAELFAAEPHLASPVAIAFDADGDAYVAEMLDYPIIRTPGMFGPFPEGQIRLLRTDAEGKVVGSSVFATAVAAPTSVLPYDGGVLVTAAPDILFFKDTDGDGHADIRQVVLTGFDTSQDLYRVNSLVWGIDGWVYARGVGDTPVHWGDDPNGPALSTDRMNFRFRIKQRKFEPVSGMASCFGMTTDDYGRLFFSNSANHVYQVVLPDHYLRRNPFLAAPRTFREVSDHGGIARVFRVSEPQPWRVERSEIWEKTGLTKKYFGKIEPRQDYMTATCGPLVYRGSLLPGEYRGNYFVCEAVSNLVHRDRIVGPGPVFTAARAEEGREFFASADNWCSPVYLQSGPDGALYVVDMYRQLIEHAGPDGGRDVPNVPLEVLQKYGLRAGSTMGRVYRVAPAGSARRPRPKLSAASPRALAEALGSEDGWWRDTAQRLILERPEAADAGAIAGVAARSPHGPARAQALWTLDALGRLTEALAAEALRDREPGVRETALKLAEGRIASSPGLTRAVLGMVDDPDPSVRFQLAFTLGEVRTPERLPALAALARRRADDPYLRAAVLSSAGDDPLALFLAVSAADGSAGLDALRSEAARVVGARLDRAEVAGLLDAVAALSRDRAAGPLRGLAAGLRRRGRRALDVPAAQGALAKLSDPPTDDAGRAAAEVATLVRALDPGQRKALVGQSAAVALAADRPAEERARAAEALGSVDAPEALAALTELLHPRVPEPVQRAALAALDGQSGPGVVAALAGAWRGLTPALRPAAAEVALGRRERLGPLLDAVRSGAIPADAFDPAQRARLTGSPDRAVAAAARAAFAGPAPRPDAQVFGRYKAALDLRGNPARGSAVFEKVCATCHKAGGRGVEVGPGLASVKGRPREQVLRDVLFPNLTFAPQYHQYVVETADGRLVTGILAASSATGYTLRRAGGEEVTVLRKDVEALNDTQVSLMPEGLLEGLGPQDVADLLEFIQQGG